MPEKKADRRTLPMQPAKYYSGVGRCIYCGRADASLSDEHIVPYAFGGNIVIREASCEACAKITSLIERRVLRDFWGKPREALNIPTRRPVRRSDKLQLKTSGDDFDTAVEVNWDKFPAMFALPRLERPGRMRGVCPSEHGRILSPWVVTCGENPPVNRQVSDQLRIGDFIAFISKLAHSFAFAQLGEAALTFWQSLPGVIDGSYRYPFYLVGGIGSDEPISATVTQTTFATSFNLHTQVLGGLEFLTVGVQMFSDIGGPKYAAIFGARTSNDGMSTKLVCQEAKS